MAGGVRPHAQVAVHGTPCEEAGVLHQAVDGVYAGVEALLQRVEVARVVGGDPLRDVAARDLGHVRCGLAHRAEDPIQGPVHALDHLAEIALVASGVGSRLELALDAGLGEPVGVAKEGVHRVDAAVEALLDGVEVAAVLVFNPGRDVAEGEFEEVVRGGRERPEHRVQGVVHPLDHLAEVALVAGWVGAGLEPALDACPRQHGGIGHEGVHRRDAAVEALADEVEVSAVLGRHGGGEVAAANPVDAFGGLADGPDEGLQGLVHPFHDGPELEAQALGVAAHVELSGGGRLAELARLSHQALHRPPHGAGDEGPERQKEQRGGHSAPRHHRR